MKLFSAISFADFFFWQRGDSALLLAISRKHDKIADLLLDYDVNVNVVNEVYITYRSSIKLSHICSGSH